MYIVMPYNFKSATSRIKTEIYNQYDKYCAAKGKTMHMDLKEYIEGVLKNESTGQLGQNGSPNKKGTATIERPLPTKPDPAPESWFW